MSNTLRQGLPGREAQYLMAPLGRKQTDLEKLDHALVKKAAVLALFINKMDRPHLVLTQRPDYKGVHGGQVSLPGGQREEHDTNFLETALRETHEEIGVDPSSVKVLGNLTNLYVPPSNFLVHPYVGVMDFEPTFVKEEAEVEEIFTVDFNRLLDPRSIKKQTIEVRNFKMVVPVFEIDHYTIWGATAMMLSELRQIFAKDITHSY